MGPAARSGGDGRAPAAVAPEAHLPLTTPAYQILLALWDRDLHGYALIQDIQARTDGEVRLTASTLYGVLARLLDAGLIDELASRRGDSRRRCYRISGAGREVVRLEAARLERQAAAARAKRVLPTRRPSARGAALGTIPRTDQR
jgi:DNA-binding PadR family transcriptional regulator